MKVSEAIRKRTSIRAYLDKPIPDKDIEKIIESGKCAPNAGPFQISVIRNSELRQKINYQTREAMLNSGSEFAVERASLPGYQPLHSAPVLILLSSPADDPFGAANTLLAAENMILEAIGLDLGSCFLFSPTPVLNDTGKRELAKAAGIPEGYTVQCSVILGYATPENKFSINDRSSNGSVNYVD